MPRRAVAAVLVLAAATGLAGCSGTVSMTPAAGANDPACAAVVTLLPDELAGLARRHTDAQATGAWGDPAQILLTCGLTPVSASPLPCQTVAGIDWLIDDSDAPRYRFTTFGRTPAVEVYLQYDQSVGSSDTLTQLAAAVGTLPTTGAVCTDRPTDTPTPTPTP